MQKIFFSLLSLFSFLSAWTQKTSDTLSVPKSIYDYTYEVFTLSGEPFDLSSLKGKKVMIVNTASKCGLTPQYKELEELYKTYKDRDFVIIGFPANNFLGQEPKGNDEIAAFCQTNYGVTFPMMAKISVKGQDQHPLYQFLTDKNLYCVTNESIQWNFQKYLINEDGIIEKVIKPKTSPLDKGIIAWIEN